MASMTASIAFALKENGWLKQRGISQEPGFQSHYKSNVTDVPYHTCSFLYHEGVRYNSANGEDKFVDNSFFRGLMGGFFLEMGAWDGIRKSNSLSFEIFYKWKGVLIEANPINFQKVVKNRPWGSINVEAVVCHAGESVEFAGKENTGRISHKVNGGSQPCTPLQHILDIHNIRHIDFFSLDVEGAEMAVLETIDFRGTSISVFMIEVHAPFVDEASVVAAFLSKHGFLSVNCPRYYKCKKGKNANIFFVHKDFVRPCEP